MLLSMFFKEDKMTIEKQQPNDSFVTNITEGVTYLTFPSLMKEGVKHGFSTRLGGVSKGIFSSMNLSFTRGDNKDHVYENYKRMGKAIGFCQDDLVFSDQVHKTNIRIVTQEDKGKGIIKPINYSEIDGLVSNIPGIPLVTFYADCVPLFFYDPVMKVAALAHSGWKGTVSRIGEKMVNTMSESFSCKPSDIITVIGPSICKECYEISEEVAVEFQQEFTKDQIDEFLIDNHNGHYHLDLWKVNEIILREAGITAAHITTANLCTCCNCELLFSHRASKGKRGNLAAFITL